MALQDFQVLARLGSGVFSCVYKVKRLIDDKFYAIKKVKLAGLKPKQRQNALNEAILLASLHHPNIVGYHEAILDPESQYLCIVMQYAQEGDLLQKILKKKENKESFQQLFIWKVLISVLNGLKKLHAKKIIHRDLKSANIFIGEKDTIKIGDLNVSKVSQEGLCFTQTGTPYYASPEIWKDQPYGTKSDIWSLGCVIYQMSCLKPPFSGQDMQQLFKSVTKGIFNRIPSHYTTQLSDILRLMLQVDPLVRPSADRLLNSSIIKKKLKEKPQLQNLIVDENDILEEMVVITEKQMKRNNIRELGLKLPGANYGRARVRTLHDQKPRYSRLDMSAVYSNNNKSLIPSDQPSSRQKHHNQIKQTTNNITKKQTLLSRLTSKHSHYKHINTKNSNIIEMARKQVMNIQQPPMLQSIHRRMKIKSEASKNFEDGYMRRMVKNRNKTDQSDMLARNIAMINAGMSEKRMGKANHV